MKLPPLFFIGLLIASCSAETPEGKPLAERRFFKSEKKPLAVAAFSVASREIPLVISKPGKTEVSDRYLAKAPADVGVQKVLVEEGAKVQPGDPLIKFDDQESGLRVVMARAEIREAEAGLEYDNYLKTNRDQLVQEGKLLALEADGLDKRIELRQATLERAKAEVDLHEKLTDLVQLNSPLGGVVTRKNVSDGAQVAEDQELLEVVRLDPIQFVFSVPVDEVASLQGEIEVAVRFPSLAGQEFTGEVGTVGSEAGPEGGAVPVKLNIQNPDLMLKADMRGEIVIRTRGTKKILPVVETALVKSERSTYVYKIEAGKLKKTPVDLGEPYNGQPTVEKGIAEGDLIVAAAGEEELQEGIMVEIQSTGAAK